MEELYKQFVILASIGAAITLGKELENIKDVKREWIKILSRIILGSFLAMSAASLWLFFPDAHFIAIAGAAAAIMILGERLVTKWVERKLFPDK